MIGVLFATYREARPLLMASRAQAIARQPFAVYRSDLQPEVHVTISGMGKVAAATAAQALILTQKVELLLNAGACGALREEQDLALGRLVRISQAQEGDHEIFGKRLQPTGCCAWKFADLPAMRLVTSDRPVFDTQLRAALAALGDVVDMEGAAVARVADYYQVPCTLIKGVTDNAQPMDSRLLLENLGMVSEQIAQKIWSVINGTLPARLLQTPGGVNL